MCFLRCTSDLDGHCRAMLPGSLRVHTRSWRCFMQSINGHGRHCRWLDEEYRKLSSSWSFVCTLDPTAPITMSCYEVLTPALYSQHTARNVPERS